MKIVPVTKDAIKLLHDGILAFSEAEHNGIRIDTIYLDRAIDEVRIQIKVLIKELQQDDIYKTWRKHYGNKTNLDSRLQLADVMFRILKYPIHGVTATGRPTADEETFSNYDLPFIKTYFHMQKLSKTAGTFLSGIKNETIDGFLHPFFDLHKVITFRSSSSGPNFQNFPARNPEMASIIRKCFVPRKGRRIVEMDFSGVEVRVSVAYHKDPVLMNYIKDSSTDMHRDTAMQLFMLKKEEVFKKTCRDSAKNMFVFPEFYGSVFFQCAPDIWQAMERRNFRVGENGISIREHLAKKGITELGSCDPRRKPTKGTFVHHVKIVEDSFWNERFKVYTSWKKKLWETYTKRGYLKTLTGFVINGIHKKNEILNAGIQGSAFHCLLWTMIETLRQLRKRKMKSKIIGQIHDSLIADVVEEELQEYLSMVKEIMTIKLPAHWDWINVPIDAEAEVTPIDGTWHDKKVWEFNNDVWAKKE